MVHGLFFTLLFSKGKQQRNFDFLVLSLLLVNRIDNNTTNNNDGQFK